MIKRCTNSACRRKFNVALTAACPYCGKQYLRSAGIDEKDFIVCAPAEPGKVDEKSFIVCAPADPGKVCEKTKTIFLLLREFNMQYAIKERDLEQRQDDTIGVKEAKDRIEALMAGKALSFYCKDVESARAYAAQFREYGFLVRPG